MPDLLNPRPPTFRISNSLSLSRSLSLFSRRPSHTPDFPGRFPRLFPRSFRSWCRRRGRRGVGLNWRSSQDEDIESATVGRQLIRGNASRPTERPASSRNSLVPLSFFVRQANKFVQRGRKKSGRLLDERWQQVSRPKGESGVIKSDVRCV